MDFVGCKEIAERLAVRPQTVAAWRHRELLPEQEGVVSGHPAWRWSTIERWAKETGRAGGIAEFVQSHHATRLLDGRRVDVAVGTVVMRVTEPIPAPQHSGGLEWRVRCELVGGAWVELAADDYREATRPLRRRRA